MGVGVTVSDGGVSVFVAVGRGVSVAEGGWKGVRVGVGVYTVGDGLWVVVGVAVGVGVKLGVNEARGVKVGNRVLVGKEVLVWIGAFVTVGVWNCPGLGPPFGTNSTAITPAQ